MKKIYHDVILDEFKTKASRLLKASRANEPTAIERLKKLSIHRNDEWKHKDALLAVAQDYGFDSWVDLKNCVENPFNDQMTSRYLNHWFRDYNEAVQFHSSNGGYLLPFKNHYFVCDRHFIEDLGLSSHDQLWKDIGFNWVTPQNPQALFYLYEELMKSRKK